MARQYDEIHADTRLFAPGCIITTLKQIKFV